MRRHFGGAARRHERDERLAALQTAAAVRAEHDRQLIREGFDWLVSELGYEAQAVDAATHAMIRFVRPDSCVVVGRGTWGECSVTLGPSVSDGDWLALDELLEARGEPAARRVAGGLLKTAPDSLATNVMQVSRALRGSEAPELRGDYGDAFREACERARSAVDVRRWIHEPIAESFAWLEGAQGFAGAVITSVDDDDPRERWSAEGRLFSKSGFGWVRVVFSYGWRTLTVYLCEEGEYHPVELDAVLGATGGAALGTWLERLDRRSLSAEIDLRSEALRAFAAEGAFDRANAFAALLRHARVP